MLTKTLATFTLFATLTQTALAAPAELAAAIAEESHRWATISYVLPDADKVNAFEKLIITTQETSKAFPDRAEPMIWQAIVLSSTAKVEGGLGALGKVKEARNLLLAAEKINPTALDGSIYNSLGSLYAKVPGWPIGFGDKKIAKTYFEKALAINPTGIDPNYFYADMLADAGDYAKAAEHLKRALAAPARAGREDADAGRRQDVIKMLEQLKQKHGDKLAGN